MELYHSFHCFLLFPSMFFVGINETLRKEMAMGYFNTDLTWMMFLIIGVRELGGLFNKWRGGGMLDEVFFNEFKLKGIYHTLQKSNYF
jgi:hypothetical protein